MGFPTILIDSATGSDSAASGAGPAVALTGSAASTDGTGLVVTLDGSPDLTGVATDGSHCVWIDHSSGRNFGRVTAKDNAAKTVTVDLAFATGLSGKSWAIGGKRASLGSASSIKLPQADMRGGWTIQLADGHSETISGTISIASPSGGDSTNGPAILRGASGAAVLPRLTFSNNGVAFAFGSVDGWIFQDFELQNSNATKTASVGFSIGSRKITVRRIKIADSTNKFWKAFDAGSGNAWRIDSCTIRYCAGVGIFAKTGGAIIGNQVTDCGSHGIQFDTLGSAPGGKVEGNVIARNGGDGVQDGSNGTGSCGTSYRHNTIHGNTGDGVEITANGSTATMPFNFSYFENNLVTGNGGYGLNLSGAPSQAALDFLGWVARNNDFGSGATANTSGAISGSLSLDPSNKTVDPSYTNAAGNDFSVGTSVKALGYPTVPVGTYGGTTSYVDIGAAQRQETGGSTTYVVNQIVNRILLNEMEP